MVEGDRLESGEVVNSGARVQIPPSPSYKFISIGNFQAKAVTRVRISHDDITSGNHTDILETISRCGSIGRAADL